MKYSLLAMITKIILELNMRKEDVDNLSYEYDDERIVSALNKLMEVYKTIQTL